MMMNEESIEATSFYRYDCWIGGIITLNDFLDLNHVLTDGCALSGPFCIPKCVISRHGSVSAAGELGGIAWQLRLSEASGAHVIHPCLITSLFHCYRLTPFPNEV